MKLIRNGRRAAAVLTLGAALVGCEDAFGPGGETPGQVSLKFEGPTTSRISASLSGDGEGSAAASSGTLKIQTVRMVLAKIKLDREMEEDECDDEERDSCEQFRTGPVLITLPLDGGTVAPLSARPPAGSYDKLEFKIHRPEGNDSLTRAFREANPSWPSTAAIHVVGTYTAVDGSTHPVDLYLKTAAKIRQRFSPPLVIDETTDPASLSLTVSVDVNRWFAADSKGALIDPRTLTSSPRALAQVERNIRESFRTRHHEDDDRGKKNGRGKKDGKKDGKDD